MGCSSVLQTAQRVEPHAGVRPPADLDAYHRLLEARGEAGHKYIWQIQRMLRGIRLEGAHILDIGAGWGRHSLFFSACNAAAVTALEPELDGCTTGAAQALNAAVAEHNFLNINLIQEDFMSVDLPDRSFDLVFTHAVINHLHELEEVIEPGSEHEALYHGVFEKMHRLLKPSGALIVVDAGRNHVGRILARVGLRHPLQPDINWRLHQTPAVWKRLMASAGFHGFQTAYYAPYAFRLWPEVWGNRLVNYLTYGLFILRGSRKQ